MAPLGAAIWPPTVQEFTRQGEPQPWNATSDHELWQEYGLSAAERADYRAGDRAFTATAWRFKDSTGSLAAWQWQRPEASKPAKGLPHGVTFDQGSMAAKGNYLVRVDGSRLSSSELDQVFADLTEFRQPPTPSLPDYLLPSRTRNSERYVLGSKSLERFIPGVSPERAGLHLGVEAQVADYTIAGANTRLVLFRYPTPQIARMKLAEFSTDVSAATHRSGPLLAVLWPLAGPAVDAKAGASLVSKIEFKAVLIENEANPNQPVKDAANMILSIFTLAGGLLALCLAGGLAMAAIRMYARRGPNGGADPFQTLHLGDR